MPGIESARQDQLGRIDPGLVVPRQDPSLNGTAATTAMVEAFRTGQISAADIADRAMKRPAIQAAVTNATDPQLVQARKAQELATSQEAVINAQRAAEAALVPVYLQNQYKALLDAGVPLQLDFKNDPQGATKQVLDSFRDLMQYHAEAMNAKSLLASSQQGPTESVDPETQQVITTQGPVDVDTGRALNPGAIDKVKDWNNKYANNLSAWMTHGKPPVETNLTFSTPGTVQVSTDAALPAGTAGAAPTPGGRVSSIKLPPSANQRPTDLQSKARYFTTAAADADGNLAKLVKEGFNPAALSNSFQEGLSTATFGATERFKTDALKRYNAAAFAWTDSFLRMQSGAAISQNEIIKLSRGYFTQGGDSPAVQQQKAKTRAKLEIMGQEVVSGKPLDPVTQTTLDDSRLMATALSDLHETANKPGKDMQAVNIGGRTGRLDNSDPANPKIIWDAPGNSTTKPYFAPGTLRKATVEPK